MTYRLHYAKLLHDFIELEPGAFRQIQLACITSEFQKISREPITVRTSDEDGGMEFPDFYYDDAVPLFSESLYDAMKNAGADNLFIKEVTVTDALQGRSQKYILGLPPRIDVLTASGVIDESRIGNYLIFKSADVKDPQIYITEKLREVFQKYKPLGMESVEVDVL